MKIFDNNFWIVLGLLVLLSGLAWGRGGTPLVGEALGSGFRLLLRFAVVIVLSFLVAGLAEVLMPREWVSAALGEDSGWRGLILASVAGIESWGAPYDVYAISAQLAESVPEYAGISLATLDGQGTELR